MDKNDNSVIELCTMILNRPHAPLKANLDVMNSPIYNQDSVVNFMARFASELPVHETAYPDLLRQTLELYLRNPYF